MNLLGITSASVFILMSGIALAAEPWPQGSDDSASTQTNTVISIPVLDNDSGNNLILTRTNPYSSKGGSVSLGDDKLTINYRSKLGFTGDDTLWYVFSDDEGRAHFAKVTVTVTEASYTGYPQATLDTATVEQNSSVEIPVLLNDRGLSIKLASSNEWTKRGGRSSVSGNNISYTPPTGFMGEDSFWYVIEDSQGRSNSAKVTVTITPDTYAGYPQATVDAVSIPQNGTIEIPVLINDRGLAIKLTSTNDWTKQGGRSSINDTSISYKAPTNFVGEDSFWYVMEDSQGRKNSAKVTVAIRAIKPQAEVDTASTAKNGSVEIPVLSNDRGLSIKLASTNDWTKQGGRSSINGTSISYQAPTDFTGIDSFWYVIEDSEGRTTSTEVTVTVLKPDTDGDGVVDDEDEFPDDASKAMAFNGAHRLLVQTTFGPVLDDLEKVQRIGAKAWVDQQLNAPSAYDSDTDKHRTHLERTLEIAQHVEPNTDWYASAVFNQQTADFNVDEYQMATWWENAIGLHPSNTDHGSDQLRQRLAFALSQLLVASSTEQPLYHRGEGLADYYDMLARHAFGNYRDLLGEMARSPVMGIYLSHQGNKKANLAKGTTPDENFARELMQLFTIGLYELNTDGSPNRDGDPTSSPDSGTLQQPSYTETDITELSKVMTGWDVANNNWYGDNAERTGDYTRPMEFSAYEHEDEVAEGGDGQVTLLGNTFALNSGRDGSGMDAVLDILFQHPNIAPHVSKHLIMRLVTSNPTPAYVGRVAQVFIDNGDGVRGDLKAVTRAILLDDEARNPEPSDERFGKIKEPIIAYTQVLRALKTVPLDGWKSQDRETLVSGVYWFKAPHEHFGQGPLRSPSVFNFYNADYVPSDPYFSSRGLVSPEMKILTNQNFHKYNNKLFQITHAYEKNKITLVDEKSLTDFAASRSFGYDIIMMSNFDDVLALMKQAAGGSFDNFEAYDAPSRPNKTAAINALIDQYDRLLLGGKMDATLRGALIEYLMKSAESSHTDKFKEARLSIKDAVRMITTSSAYMFQR